MLPTLQFSASKNACMVQTINAIIVQCAKTINPKEKSGHGQIEGTLYDNVSTDYYDLSIGVVYGCD